MNNVYKSLIALGVVILLSGFFGCNGPGEKINYKKINFNITGVDFESKDLPYINSAVIKNDRIYAIHRELWHIDPVNKKEEKCILSGVGPNEVYKPARLDIYDHYCWCNTVMTNQHIFRFDTSKPQVKIEMLPLPEIIRFQDFIVIGAKKIAATNVYWDEALLKIIDLEKGKIKNCGKAYKSEIMDRFNVSMASIAAFEGFAYITQSVVPYIEVFSLEKGKKVEIISLKPPFYKPIPDEYKVNKFDRKGHKDWMARWTGLKDIIIEDGWVLLRYRKGYNTLFYYELFQLKDKSNRYYIDSTVEYIYDLKVKGKTLLIKSCEMTDDSLLWKSGQIQI